MKECRQSKEYLLLIKRIKELEEENLLIRQDYTNKCALISSQKEMISKLKEKLENSTKAELAIQNLVVEIKTLQQEKFKQNDIINKLTSELKQSKFKEDSLAKLLKHNSSHCKCNDMSLMAVNELVPRITLHEEVSPNKSKVVIPKLDFSPESDQ